MGSMAHDEWMEEVFKPVHANSQLTEISKKYLANTPLLRNAMPKVMLNKKGYLVEDEGIDLSEVPMCVRCGLEVANKAEHEAWHQQQEAKFRDLEKKVYDLELALKNLLASPVQAPNPSKWVSPHNYITEDEIRKYSQNPGKHPPPFKSGDKWGPR